MKIKSGLVLRQVGDSFVVVPTGNAQLHFNGMITLNAVGALLWRSVEDGFTREQAIYRVTELYDVDAEAAGSDVDAFYAKLWEAGLVEE